MVHTGDFVHIIIFSIHLFGHGVIYGIGLWLNVFWLWYIGGYGGGAVAGFPKGCGAFVVSGKSGADAESDEGHGDEEGRSRDGPQDDRYDLVRVHMPRPGCVQGLKGL